MTDVPAKSPAHAQMDCVSTAALKPSQVSYINFCSVTATPEELVIDFALEAEPSLTTPPTLRAPQRITLGLYTAKRLLEALQITLQRHEATFGSVQTNVDERLVQPQP